MSSIIRGTRFRHCVASTVLALSVALLFVLTIARDAPAQRADSGARVADTLPAGSTLPLVPTRPLRFTTDEGTWMSVDVSPDGRTLAFDLLGDLYTLPVSGGKATRITSGQAFDGQPRWSPDGRQIAFVSDRNGASNLWVAAADGSRPRAITRTERFTYVSPTWTPNGRAVLVSRNNTLRASGPFDLYLYSAEGGGSGQRLTGGGPPPATPPVPGPPGAAAAARTYFGGAFADSAHVWYSTTGVTAQLFILDLQTGESTQRTAQRAGAVRPTLSPNGQWLVYATRRNDVTAFRLRELATGDERWLAENAQHDQMSGSPTRDLMPGMAFTPDSKALIATYGGKLWRVEVPSGRATAIPFTADVDQMMGASTQFQYALNDSTLEVRQIRVPRLSPDGRRVALVALDRVWIGDLPTAGAAVDRPLTLQNLRRLSDFPVSEYAPTWSPDGQTIAFVTWSDSTGGDIYRVRVAGGRPEKLSRASAYYEKLAYTPDGTKLLFARASRADRFETDELGFAGPSTVDADLLWMPANGGTPTLITRLDYLNRLNPPYYGAPHFGPDTSRVLLYDATANGLYSLRLDGTDRRLLVRSSERPWNSTGEDPVDDIVLSPRGDRAALLGMQNVYVATVVPGVAAPTFSVIGAGSGPLPIRRVSKIGGNFVGWSADGKILHYALGPALFLYDVARADSLARTGAPYEATRVDVQITVPKDRPTGTVVLRGARLLTMRGADADVIENGDLVVRGNRIAALGARGAVAIPSGARVIDVAGKTILPGYVDTHAHMYAPGLGLHRTELWQYYANLAYGVTATRDPQTMTSDVLDYADLVEKGDILGPRIFSTARGFFDQEEISSLEDARNALRRNSDFLKTETIKQYLVGDRKRRQWVAQAAQALKLSPTNEGGADFMLDLTHMLDGYAGEEHTLPTYPLYKDVVELAAQSSLTYTPVLTVSYGSPTLQEYFTSRFNMRAEKKVQRFWPRSYMDLRTVTAQWRPDEYYAFPKLAADAAKIAAAGGRIGVGSHGNLQGIGYHLEMWGLTMGGMSPREVLRSATVVGAQAIGHTADLGSLEVGKLADLQVLDANPLENIRNTNTVRYVMKNGRLYEAETLDEIWPRSRKLPVNQWWMDPAR